MNLNRIVMSIEEGNSLILNSPFVPDDVKININHYTDSGNDYELARYHTRLKFHSDWNYLMAVVEKINETKQYDVIIYRTTCHINDEREILIETGTTGSLIYCVWLAVTQFIYLLNQ